MFYEFTVSWFTLDSETSMKTRMAIYRYEIHGQRPMDFLSNPSILLALVDLAIFFRTTSSWPSWSTSNSSTLRTSFRQSGTTSSSYMSEDLLSDHSHTLAILTQTLASFTGESKGHRMRVWTSSRLWQEQLQRVILRSPTPSVTDWKTQHRETRDYRRYVRVYRLWLCRNNFIEWSYRVAHLVCYIIVYIFEGTVVITAGRSTTTNLSYSFQLFAISCWIANLQLRPVNMSEDLLSDHSLLRLFWRRH